MARLKDKIAIVTGGASGIGNATAALFADEGATVIVADIDAVLGKATASNIPGGYFFKHDAGDEGSWKALMSDILNRYRRLDVLINNAAITGIEGPLSDPESTTIENWRAIHRVNSEGVFLGCKHAIAAMKGNEGASIVNISSSGAIIPSPMNMPYSVAKAGVLNLTITVAIHCAVRGYGIRCNAVLPGGTRTPLMSNMLGALADKAGIEATDSEGALAKGLPSLRLADPREIANAILFLASDESSYVNAACMTVDNGTHCPTFLAI